MLYPLMIYFDNISKYVLDGRYYNNKAYNISIWIFERLILCLNYQWFNYLILSWSFLTLLFLLIFLILSYFDISHPSQYVQCDCRKYPNHNLPEESKLCFRLYWFTLAFLKNKKKKKISYIRNVHQFSIPQPLTFHFIAFKICLKSKRTNAWVEVLYQILLLYLFKSIFYNFIRIGLLTKFNQIYSNNLCQKIHFIFLLPFFHPLIINEISKKYITCRLTFRKTSERNKSQ